MAEYVPQPVGPPEPEITKDKAKSAKRAFMLGFIPGVGALYNGQYRKAAIHVAIFLFISAVMQYVPVGLRETWSWVRIAFFFYMAFDAYHIAQKKN
jgi:hypothetical protein